VVSLEVPDPTGLHPVGRQRLVLVDQQRPESHTAEPNDRREVHLTLWYPARTGTGRPAPYVDNLDVLAPGLQSGGDLGKVAVRGLRYVRDGAMADAAIADAQPSYPLVLLSPGNETNVEFYASLAEELASHGYVVAGVNHPYQVAAVVRRDGTLAVHQQPPRPRSPREALEQLAAKIDERTQDLRFVLTELRQSAARGSLLAGRLDATRTAVIGHSNGGVAAAEMCRADRRIAACVNIDGLHAGGPFSSRADAQAPAQPFLFLTKERQLRDMDEATFQRAGHGAYKVVVPAANHDEFADGARFEQAWRPFARSADNTTTVTRAIVSAFLRKTLKGATGDVFGGLPAPTDIHIYGYPLPGK
jgi:dienelactone hydrolase